MGKAVYDFWAEVTDRSEVSYCKCAPYNFDPQHNPRNYHSSSFARALGGLPSLDLGTGMWIQDTYFVVPLLSGE